MYLGQFVALKCVIYNQVVKTIALSLFFCMFLRIIIYCLIVWSITKPYKQKMLVYLYDQREIASINVLYYIDFADQKNQISHRKWSWFSCKVPRLGYMYTFHHDILQEGLLDDTSCTWLRYSQWTDLIKRGILEKNQLHFYTLQIFELRRT